MKIDGTLLWVVIYQNPMKLPGVVRFGSWNVNSLRVRLDAVCVWLQQSEIDVALLQETKVQDEDFPWKTFQDMGFEAAFWGQKSYNGVAILSRLPLSHVCRYDLNGSGQARWLQGRAGPFHVTSVYVPQGQSIHAPAFQEKASFFQGLLHRANVSTWETHPCVMGGDWNIAPTDQDVSYPDLWHDHVMCTGTERLWMRRLVATGWGDAGAIQDNRDATWWPYRHQARERGNGLRIDLFLLNPAARDRLSHYAALPHWRDDVRPSDHIPLFIDVRS